MSELHPTANNHPPRVLRIWLPSRKAGWLALVVLAIGILISYAIACVILGGIISALSELLDRIPSGILFPIIIVLAGFGPYVWICFYNHWQYKWRLKPTRHRCARLNSVFSANTSVNRLPHRYIEQLMRMKSANTTPIKRAMLCLSPGVVIVANGPKLDDPPRLMPNDIHFEPIDLIEDVEQAAWLVTANYEKQNRASHEYLVDDEDADAGTPAHLYQQARYWINKFFSIVGLLVFLCWPFLNRSNPIEQWIIIVLVILVAFIALISGLFIERRWWLVPGGVFCREYRFWRKELKVKIIRATETPLFLNLEEGWGLVVDDGKVRAISFSSWTGLAILAGWISSANTPTEHEIQSFVGISNSLRSDKTN